MSDRKWHLLQGDVLLGEIIETGFDFPWHHGTFAPKPAFDSVADLFAATKRFTDAEEFDTPESDAAFEAVMELRLSLRDFEKNTLFDEVFINLDGQEVTWRC